VTVAKRRIPGEAMRAIGEFISQRLAAGDKKMAMVLAGVDVCPQCDGPMPAAKGPGRPALGCSPECKRARQAALRVARRRAARANSGAM